MDPLMWLLKNRYGSLELSRQVGPNLLRGLAGSVLLHACVVTALFVMAVVNTSDRGTIGPLPPPIEILPAFPRPVVQPKIIRDLPAPKPPDVITKPVPVPNDPTLTVDDPKPTGPVGIPGPDDVMGTGTKPIDAIPPNATVIIDDEIPDENIFIAREFEPVALDINPRPAYPELAFLSGISGKVVMKVFVDKQGNVGKWRVFSVNPAGLGFEEAVEKVIPKWKFTPAIQQDRPVGVWVSLPFKFSITR